MTLFNVQMCHCLVCFVKTLFTTIPLQLFTFISFLSEQNPLKECPYSLLQFLSSHSYSNLLQSGFHLDLSGNTPLIGVLKTSALLSHFSVFISLNQPLALDTITVSSLKYFSTPTELPRLPASLALSYFSGHSSLFILDVCPRFCIGVSRLNPWALSLFYLCLLY